MSSIIGWDIILIDTSASMILSTNDVKQGIDDLFSEQIQDNSTNKLSIFTFNTKVYKNGDYYFPNPPNVETIDLRCFCKTSLIDAIGTVYQMILDDLNTEYSLISINIITDGIENSSKNYKLEDILESRIKILEKQKIVINFIGADETCLDDSEKYQTTTSRNCNGDFIMAFQSLSDTMSSQRSPDYDYSSQPGSTLLSGIKRNRSPLSTPHNSPISTPRGSPHRMSGSPHPQLCRVNIQDNHPIVPRRNYSTQDLHGIEMPPPLIRDNQNFN